MRWYCGKDISADFSGDDWKNAYETEEEKKLRLNKV